MINPDITFIDTYISDGNKNPISLTNFSDKLIVSTKDDYYFKISTSDIFIKYREQFMDIVQYMPLPNDYYYSPKMLSYVVYGTTELWLPIMRLNSMKNITEFEGGIIAVYDPNRVFDIINVFFKREGK